MLSDLGAADTLLLIPPGDAALPAGTPVWAVALPDVCGAGKPGCLPPARRQHKIVCINDVCA
jgi:hypothetical protein